MDFENSQYYTNRELSWIQFNYRVLEEARDKSNPLFERLKFLSITSSNLDEFFMVRVASLKDMVNAGYKKPDIAGMTPKEQLSAISEALHEFTQTQYSTYNRSLLPLLAKEHITVLTSFEQMNDEEASFADNFFMEKVYPVLTPMAVDASRPFPLIRNKSLNIAALIKTKNQSEEEMEPELEFATVQVPSVMGRIVQLPCTEGVKLILLEEIIRRNISKLFLNYDVISTAAYRIERNADLSIDEEEAEDLLQEIEKQLKQRQWGEVIRLEVEDTMDKKLLKELKKHLDVVDRVVYKINGPLDLTFLMKVNGLPGFDHLKYEKYVPQPAFSNGDYSNIFDKIKKHDRLLFHPYYEFTPVIEFIRQAAVDPNVLAIKQTLYRVSGNSPIIAALEQAAENGKQVTVLVELKARFDEENNIAWAKKLEKAGCHVIYGLVGLKTHSKIALVVRREEDGIKRYVHLGTGNYNDQTAKLYTDMGLLTCSDPIGEDATAVFNMLSGYSEPGKWNKLAVAPIWLKDKFLMLINREAENARQGKKARIIAKMNSLCDPKVMEALYDASAAGVKIDLIVRGICCIKAGVPGLSENISVRSIVGNFLEHSRIFYFYNDGFEDIYMGSADWMPRNLDKRVEITFPVEDTDLKKRIKDILKIQLADTLKAHIMQPDGSYEKQDLRGKVKLDSQMYFAEEARKRSAKPEDADAAISHDRVFIPIEAEESEH